MSLEQKGQKFLHVSQPKSWISARKGEPRVQYWILVQIDVESTLSAPPLPYPSGLRRNPTFAADWFAETLYLTNCKYSRRTISQDYRGDDWSGSDKILPLRNETHCPRKASKTWTKPVDTRQLTLTQSQDLTDYSSHPYKKAHQASWQHGNGSNWEL